MVKDHIKRINAPRRWDILRKDNTFISRPNAGRDFTLCIALNTVLKEMLQKTKTTKESKYLIKNKGVTVNGKPVFDEKFPVGFLDVISFPAIKENYRLLVNQENKLVMLKVREDEAGLKLSKVLNRKNLSADVVQLNCSDGRNFELKKSDQTVSELRINDSILYTIPEQKIKETLKMEKGVLVFLYKGKHIGIVVAVEDFKGDNIVFRIGKEAYETKKAYAFVVGKNKPLITVSGKFTGEEQEQEKEKHEK